MLEELNQPLKFKPEDVQSRLDKMATSEQLAEIESTILPLRKVLVDEDEDMGKRYRALFSLKYLACQQPPTELSEPAIEAIAAAFGSKSELLKHECAYCLGQTKNEAAVGYLQDCLKDESQHIMCRHEAGEALGALNHAGSLDLLRKVRDDEKEAIPLRETCELAVARIEYEHSKLAKEEKLKTRYAQITIICHANNKNYVLRSSLANFYI